MEFERIDGGVCAAKGFVANGLNCGLNPDKNKNDLALVYSQTECLWYARDRNLVVTVCW